MQTEGKFTTYDVYHRYSGLLEKEKKKIISEFLLFGIIEFLDIF